MGRPLLYEVLEKPASSILIALCTSIWLYIQKHGITYSDVGISYEAVIGSKQHWRIISATFSHVNFLHLLFNMSALWSLGVAEQLHSAGLGLAFYLKATVLLAVLSGLLVLAIYHLLVHRLRLEQYRRVTALGYSCVVFGWMTILSQKQPSSKLELFGLLSLPISFAPFESLIFTSIIVPQASFVGHLAGIVVGYLIGWGVFSGISNYWALTGTIWLMVATLINLKQTSSYDLPWLKIESVGLEAGGTAGRLVGGHILSSPGLTAARAPASSQGNAADELV